MNFHLEALASPEEVVSTLRVHGVVVVRNYVSKEKLDGLMQEYFRAFSQPDPGIYSLHKHPLNPDGKVARAVTEKLTTEKFSITREIFLSKQFQEIAKRYFDPYTFDLNDEIFFTNEFPCESEILPWHFDRNQSLKFWIYMTDTSVDNGAFHYCPGSHIEGHLRANYNLLRGVPQKAIPNDLPLDEIRNAMPITGNAGDLVIFDADGFHKGGVVKPGNERRIIRGHCHPTHGRDFSSRVMARLLSSLYRLQSRYSHVLERRIGTHVQTGAMKTRADSYAKLKPGAGDGDGMI